MKYKENKCILNKMIRLKLNKIILLLVFTNFLMSKSLFSQCIQKYNWTTWTSFTNNLATGNILYNGQVINVNISANYNFSSTSNIFNYGMFNGFFSPPPDKSVPKTTWAIGQGGVTKMCFSEQVENPVLLLSSQGDPATAVSLKFSRPFIVVYDGGGNEFPNDSTIIGKEGYSIIKFPGKFDCVTIYSNDFESYTNITWGLNPPLFPIQIEKKGNSCLEEIIKVSGGEKYSWTGGLYPDSSINTFTKNGTYFLTVTDALGCTVNSSVDINIDSLLFKNYNPFPDTIIFCNKSEILDAGNGFNSYQWNSGENTRSIYPTISGRYKVIATSNTCILSDSTFVSIIKSNIIQGDTTICKEGSILLSSEKTISTQKNWRLISENQDIYTRIIKTNDGKYLASAQSSNRLYVSNDLYKFSVFNSPLISHNLSFGKDKNGILYFGTSHEGIFRSSDNGISWKYAVGSGFGCGNLDFEADDQNVLYTSIGGFCRGLHVSKDGGNTWLNTFAGIDFTDIEVLSGTNKVFITSGGKVWVTANQGGLWNQILGQPFSSNTIMIKSLNGRLFVFSNNGNIYESLDSGNTWNLYSKITLFSTPTIYLNDALIFQDGIWFVNINQNGIFRSIDNGKTWNLTSQQMTGNTHYLFSDGINVLATTSTGIYKYENETLSSSLVWSTGSFDDSITVSPKQTTKYFLTVSQGITSCKDSITVNVVNIDTSLSLLDSIPRCSNSFSIRMSLISGYEKYQWKLNDIDIIGANSDNYTASKSGIYQVLITGNSGCQDSSRRFEISVNPIPISDFSINKNPQCLSDNYFKFVSTSTISSGQMNYNWNFGDNSMSVSSTPEKKYTTSGTFIVKLLSISDRGCSDSIKKNITIFAESPGVKYNPVNVIANRPQQLSARNIGVKYLWSPTTNLSGFTSPNPTLTTSKEQQYLIYITNNIGCITVDTLNIRLFNEADIFVPKGFTPDGDGFNDELFPISVGIVEIKYFKIFSRWGELVYEGKNLNINSGWNGKFKGKDMKMDTYTWVVSGVDNIGRIISKSGNTILIR